MPRDITTTAAPAVDSELPLGLLVRPYRRRWRLVLAVLAALLNRDLAIGVVVLVAPYLLATVTASVLACAARQRWKYLPVMPLVFACYHFGYAFGFLGGVWNFLVRGRRSHGAFESLTR